jgi:hypothetical protein
MKKSLKVSLLALVFTVGIGGAVVQKISAAPKPFDSTYNWTSTSAAPENPSSTLSNATISDAQNRFGCSGVSAVCANGVNTAPGQPGATIKLN